MPDPKAVRIHAPSLQLPCVHCHEQFRPNPRLGDRQKTCGKELCRKAHHANYRRVYRSKNPQSEQDVRDKLKAGRPTDYWKRYRGKNPGYTARNRAQSRLRKRLAKAGLQRQLDIVQLVDPPEKLDQLVEFATSHRSLLQECQCKPAA